MLQTWPRLPEIMSAGLFAGFPSQTAGTPAAALSRGEMGRIWRSNAGLLVRLSARFRNREKFRWNGGVGATKWVIPEKDPPEVSRTHDAGRSHKPLDSSSLLRYDDRKTQVNEKCPKKVIMSSGRIILSSCATVLLLILLTNPALPLGQCEVSTQSCVLNTD